MRSVDEDERKPTELKVPANPPTKLQIQAAGRALWKRIMAEVTLELPDELEHLICACQCVDEIERMRDTLRDELVMIPGSKGQKVAHPLFAELRLHRATLAKHLDGLRMAGAADSAESRSANGRALALTRWNRQVPGQGVLG